MYIYRTFRMVTHGPGAYKPAYFYHEVEASSDNEAWENALRKYGQEHGYGGELFKKID